ncbi:MAG: hypothetical protein IJ193_05225, partial [Bacilli bacterium]|nr:hypothetical protein [Bacilli bacterium]
SLTPLGDKITIQGEECYRLTTEEEDAIKGYALSSTNPKIVVEYVDVELEKEKDVIDEDVITIYRDVDDPDMFFATKEILDRFGITPTSSVIKIAGKDLYLISVDEHDQIKQLASESVDPRISIEYEPIQREKETIVLFENSQDPSDIFASIDILSRFGITPSGTSESIFGLESYPISADIVQTIKDLANKSINPIITVEMRKFEKKIEDTIENVDITLYRDLSDNNQIYATDEVLERFYIPPVGATTNVNGEDCYKISNDAHEMIKGIAKNSYNPKINIHYVDVRLKKPEKHYLKILDEVTTGLTIGRKDAKRYYAFHSDPLGGFLSDIHSGNYMYNIVHVLSGVVPLAGGLLNKYASRLLSSEKGRKVIAELENRLRNLPEEELEVLFRDYRGSELKQNMNVAINDVILRVLRDYGMKKVAKLNAEIKGYYKALYPLLLQIQELNKKLDRGVFKDDAEREACLQARKTLCDQAGPLIIKIEDARSKANHLLSDGIHGMEEDFKAVATKLSYVGMRFAKTYDYDNELSAQLGRFGQGLKDSMHSNDNVGIVENFMNLEHCYYSNSETRKSIFGERSTGKKYYTPLAVPFDYRDDPFLKDLFASIAIATSVVSAVNAFRTHVTESRRLLQQQQQMANQANAQNAQAIGYARQVGQQIEGKRGAFQEGMEAQIYQAAHANGTGLERAAMDEFGWGNFDSAYHAADAANHATYNSFFDQASSGITQVAIQRGQGLITEAQALQQLARIANNCQAQSNHIINQCLNVLKPYAASHPQFDLHGIQQAMQYVVNHPNAIANMNQAAVDVTDLAGTLSGLTAAQVTALSHLPSDMLTTFLGSVASLAFVHRVTDDMSKSAAFTGANKGRAVQENDEEMADMFDELYGDREETAHKRR